MCYKVGDGRSINIWDDPWVPKEPDFRTKLKTRVAPNNLLVVEFIHHDSRQWDREKIFDLFKTRSTIRILNIHILASSKCDTLCRGLSPSSEFTVKSAYMLKMQQSSTSLGPMHEEYWKMLWKSKMHERLKLLLWRIVCKSLLVQEILSKRFPIPNISCPVYGEEVETVEHVFIRCPITIQAWANLIWPLNMDVFKDINIDQWIKIIINRREMLKIQGKEAKEFTLFAAVLCDQIWRNRNQTVWGSQPVDLIKLSIQINKVFIQHKQAWQSILGEKENSPSWKPPPL